MVIKADRMKFPRVLSPEEVARMFKAAQDAGAAQKAGDETANSGTSVKGSGKRDEMMLKCMYYLGLKSNEIQGLRQGDIDIKENTILIRGKNERELLIPGKFPFELAKFTAGRQQLGDAGDGLIFPGRGPGGAMSDRHIRRVVKDYARLAEVRNYEEIKPHSLRISYAAHLRKDGVSVKTIQQLLGHARRETTYIYTHGLQKMGSETDEKSAEVPEKQE